MEDIIVRKDDDIDVGYRRRGMLSGAIGAFGNIDAMDVLPPLVGGVVTYGTTLLVRKFGKSYPTLRQLAPMLGSVGGILLSVPMYWWRGEKAVVSGAMTSLVAGLGLWGFEKVSTSAWALSGVHAVSRTRMAGGVGAQHLVQGARARALPTAMVPGQVQSAMDVRAFGATMT